MVTNHAIRIILFGGLCLLLSSILLADNQLKIGDVTNSKVIIFQGTTFDFREEKQFKKLVKVIRGDSKIYKKLQVFFNVSIDDLWAKKHQQQYETLVRLMSGINTAPQLEERLDKAEAAQQALLKRIAELEQQQDSEPKFKAVLEKAKTVLAKKDFQQYHLVLQTFTDLRKQQVEKLTQYKEEIAEAAYLRAEEYSSRLDYHNAVIQMAEAVEYAPQNSAYWNRYGQRLDDIARYDDVIAAYKEALAIDLKVHGEQHHSVAIRYNNLGEAWRKKGKYNRAIGYFEKALAVDLNVRGEQYHLQVATYYNNLGSAWGSKGQYNRAIEYYEKALAIDLKVFGEQHPDTAIDYNNLGLAWGSKGQYDRAIEYYEKALVIAKTTFGDEHTNTKTVVAHLKCARKKHNNALH